MSIKYNTNYQKKTPKTKNHNLFFERIKQVLQLASLMNVFKKGNINY